MNKEWKEFGEHKHAKNTQGRHRIACPGRKLGLSKSSCSERGKRSFFGVEKFNARARADNFQIDELAEIMSYLHKYGVKGFLTFNILVFEEELKDAKELIEACVEAGVDAVIVQDLGLVKMIREIPPDFPIHGST